MSNNYEINTVKFSNCFDIEVVKYQMILFAGPNWNFLGFSKTGGIASTRNLIDSVKLPLSGKIAEFYCIYFIFL